MNHFVYDSLYNPHVRKNLYLKDVADGIKTNRASHAYNLELKKLLDEEKIFLTSLKKLKASEKESLKNKYDKKFCCK